MRVGEEKEGLVLVFVFGVERTERLGVGEFWGIYLFIVGGVRGRMFTIDMLLKLDAEFGG